MFPETSKQVGPRIPKRVSLVLGIVLGVSFALFVAVNVSNDTFATYVPTSEAWSWYQDKTVCPEMTPINITQLGAIAVINDLNHSVYIEWQNKGQVLRDTFLEAGQFSSYPSSLFQPIDIVWILDDVSCTYYIPDGIYNDMYRVSQIKDRCVRLTSTIPYPPDCIAYVQGIIQYTEYGVNKILRTGHVGYDKTGTVAIPLNATNVEISFELHVDMGGTFSLGKLEQFPLAEPEQLDRLPDCYEAYREEDVMRRYFIRKINC
jgi:hypothetical protein